MREKKNIYICKSKPFDLQLILEKEEKSKLV